MMNKKTCLYAETNKSPHKKQKNFKSNQVVSIAMVAVMMFTAPASDIMITNVYAENLQIGTDWGNTGSDSENNKNDNNENSGSEDNKDDNGGWAEGEGVGDDKGDGSGGSGTGSEENQNPTPTPTAQEKKEMESIMTGLSTFDFKAYKWPSSLNIGTLAYSMADSLYKMRKSESKKTRLWDNDDDITKDMKNFYSSTNWNNFEGMYETIEISNSCQAILTEEVKQYEELLDAAAAKYGFTPYKEIFKAMAQARFNEYKDDYEEAKATNGNKLKKTTTVKVTVKDKDGKKTDKEETKEVEVANENFRYDLFHIDGSWLARVENGDKTPVGAAVAPTATPEPTPIPWTYISGTPVPPPPTPWPERDDETPSQKKWHRENGSSYTVADSIDIAAQAFAKIIEDAGYPSPYSTDTLMSAVQGFEFGGDSDQIQKRYRASSTKPTGFSDFVTFTEYCDQQAMTMKKEDSDSNSSSSNNNNEEDVDYDAIIAKYANAIAYGEKRQDDGAHGDTKHGDYKYSDQFFYEKAFANYTCSGGGSIDLGNLPDDLKQILKECMKTWDSRVTKERREIIQQGILLYGVKYGSDGANGHYKNTPSVDNPQYLDCSSFVAQAYWRAGILTRNDAATWFTGTFCENFDHLSSADELIPGDTGQKSWSSGGGPTEHIGIYIGTVNGTRYWLHCTSGSGFSGITINDYGRFTEFGRCKTLK